MFEKLFDPAKRFITVIGSSIGGITALFAAAGFLAETTHLSVLGISEWDVAYQQFVVTGSKFFITLTVYFILAVVTNLLNYALFFIVIAVCWFGYKALKKYRRKKNPNVPPKIKLPPVKKFILLQILLTFFALYCVTSLYTKIFNQRDLLYQNELPYRFVSPAPAKPSPFEILYQNLVLLTIFFLVIVGMTENFRQKIPKEKVKDDLMTKFSYYFPLFFYLIVLIQVLMLPMNFGGILLISKHYPIVQIKLTQSQIYPQITPAKKLAILISKDNEYLFYSPIEQKSWLVQKATIEELTFISKGNIFKKEIFQDSLTPESNRNEKPVKSEIRGIP